MLAMQLAHLRDLMLLVFVGRVLQSGCVAQ
jgi:hypothetical protein